MDARLARVIEEGPAATPLLELPGGTFVMGCEGRPDELPRHPVTIEAFAVALAPVTNAEYAHFLAAGLEAAGHEQPRFWLDPHFTEGDRPVVGVNWYDAVAYCEWLSTLLGRTCRLPTEAEREFAALGGLTDGRAYPWGDEPWSGGVFAFGAAGMDRPIPVGSTEPNGYGLYHVAENVHEWCSDWYAADYYAVSASRNPAGPESGARRVSRGGSWRHQVRLSRCAARSSIPPGFQYADYGFRIACDPADTFRAV